MNSTNDELITTAPLGAYQIASGVTIAEGDLVSINTSAQAVKAGDTSGTTFVGVAGAVVDGGVMVADGILALPNSTVSSSMIGRADRGKPAYCLGSNTVGRTAGTNKIPAGIVIDVTDGGQVFVDTRPAAKAAALGLTTSSNNL